MDDVERTITCDLKIIIGRNWLKTDTRRYMFMCREMSQYYVTETTSQHVNREENGARSCFSNPWHRAIVKRVAATKLPCSTSFFLHICTPLAVAIVPAQDYVPFCVCE